MLCVYPHPHFWILHSDGSAMPNPGHMAIGVVLTGPQGEVYRLSQPLLGRGCNNEAELRALQAGVELAQAHGASALRIYTDSHWLLEQLAQTPLRLTVRLQPRLDLVHGLLQQLEQVQWRWVPRHHNTEADALARTACLSLLPRAGVPRGCSTLSKSQPSKIHL